MSSVYDNPKYYDIAFSFRDIPAEVDAMEACINRYSRVSVLSVLEVGCGNSPHFEELARRGYRYVGLDLSEAMLKYSRDKAQSLGIDAEIVRGDMAEFSLGFKVDFAFVALGSLYVKNTAGLFGHLDAMANSMNAGGLYLLDWCVQFRPLETKTEIWEMERDGVRVRTVAEFIPVNRVNQTYEEKLTLEVNDRGKTSTLTSTTTARAIFPQEFLLLVNHQNDFEFMGWWNNWDLDQPLEHAEDINRPLILLRRK